MATTNFKSKKKKRKTNENANLPGTPAACRWSRLGGKPFRNNCSKAKAVKVSQLQLIDCRPKFVFRTQTHSRKALFCEKLSVTDSRRAAQGPPGAAAAATEKKPNGHLMVPFDVLRWV